MGAHAAWMVQTLARMSSAFLPLKHGHLQDRGYLGDAYKRAVLEHMSIQQLTDTLMINPTVHLSPSYRDTGLSASYTFQPLSNLVSPNSVFNALCMCVVRHQAQLTIWCWAWQTRGCQESKAYMEPHRVPFAGGS